MPGATPGLGDVFDVSNTNKGRTYSITAQLQRPFRDDWEGSVAYTYGRAKDVNSLTSSVAQSNFQFNLVPFNPNEPELTTSNYDIPSRVVGLVLAIPLMGMLKVICDEVPGLKPWGELLGEERVYPKRPLKIPANSQAM